jgi:XTP/dITP diphosphohydrolase
LELIVATKNKHKIAEITAVTEDFGFRVIGRDEAGLPDFEVEETGATFEENALLKARAIAAEIQAGKAVIADDSGLMVDVLDGAPGLYSARFAAMDGRDAAAIDQGDSSDEANNAKLLRLLADIPMARRNARFVSVIALLHPDRQDAILVRGECAGRIAFSVAGKNGFGYDPLFVPQEYEAEGKTFAQLLPAEKNAISHRARALEKLREALNGASCWSF